MLKSAEIVYATIFGFCEKQFAFHNIPQKDSYSI